MDKHDDLLIVALLMIVISCLRMVQIAFDRKLADLKNCAEFVPVVILWCPPLLDPTKYPLDE